MADDLAKKANEAFVDEDFDRAVELYTEAIRSDPKNANLFVNRSQAHIKLQNFTDALVDANRAIELDSSMPKAYLRKGFACYSLEEYHTAKAAFEAGHNLDANNAVFKTWIQKCDTRLLEEAATDGNERQADSSLPSSGAAALPLHSSGVAPTMPDQQQATGPVHMDFVNNRESGPSNSSKPKYRHEFYQKPNEVVVFIFAKGLSGENVKIEFGEQFLSVIIEVPGEEQYALQKRLFAKIIPEQSRYSIFSMKIEIRLAKAYPIHWTSLDYEKQQGVQQKFNIPSDLGSCQPTYPSSNSSQKARKDWDMIEAQVKKEEKEEKLEGDAALNKLFRDIYRDADEDTRRAMSKSFVESNGTVLSTNWKEVGSKRVEGSPPQGMVMKKWEI